GCVQRAINRNVAQGLPTDFWSLRLPTETMNYVPRFIAVAQMVKNPQNYGVQLPNIANRSHFRSVALSGSVDLEQLVRITGLSSKDVLELNPGFLQGVTSPSGPHRVLIPNSLSMMVDSRLKALPIIDPSRFGFSSDGGLLAMSQPVTQTITQSVTRSNAPVPLSTTQAASIMSGTRTSNLGNVTSSISIRNNQRIPTDSESLAAMANQAVVPSSARIAKVVENVQKRPVSTTQTVTTITKSVVQPVVTKTDATTMTISTRPVTNNVTFTPISAADSVNSVSTLANNTVSTPANNSNIVTSTVITNTVNTITTPLPITPSPIVVEPAQAPNITPIIAMSIDKKTPDQNSTTFIDPLDGKIAITTLQPLQTVIETKTETRVSNIEVKKPTTSDLKATRLIPAETKVIAEVKAPEKPKGTRTIYTVKAGDTLLGVANKAGLSWRDIAKWNQMDAHANLIMGTPLYLYGAKKVVEAAPTSYVVQAGDTLTDVAAKFDLTTRQLADRNDLKVTSNLMKGARLNLIENNDSTSSKESSSKDSYLKVNDKSNEQSAAKTDEYTIKRGDTLAKVAPRYNLT
ncbi:MAG TPA: LysM peptidoglycan-binding domain-containing protein, partial [Aquirhabdus sp.]